MRYRCLQGPNWSPSPHAPNDEQFEPAAYCIMLRGLVTELRPGETVPVTYALLKVGSKAMRGVELPLASSREPVARQ
jgi:copper(I)-binding protein